MVVMVVAPVIVGQILVTVVQPAHVDARHIVQVGMRRMVVVVQVPVVRGRETIHRPGLFNATNKQHLNHNNNNNYDFFVV